VASRLDPKGADAAKTGDVEALNAVLACSRPDLRRYAQYDCEAKNVENAVQETLFAVSRRMRDLRQTESAVAWLFCIVRRECNRMRCGWRMLTRALARELLSQDNIAAG
jgi:DNA-directed RNA polymerase specialized sigma24 family protein